MKRTTSRAAILLGTALVAMSFLAPAAWSGEATPNSLCMPTKGKVKNGASGQSYLWRADC